MAAAWWAGVRVAGRVSDPATLLETEAALEPETSLSTEQPRRNARSETIYEIDVIVYGKKIPETFVKLNAYTSFQMWLYKR